MVSLCCCWRLWRWKKCSTLRGGPINWCLITTHKISCFENACRIVRWYQNRRNIEQILRTLKKQGLDIDLSQLEKAQNLIKLKCIDLLNCPTNHAISLARQSITTAFNGSEAKDLKEILKAIQRKTYKQKTPPHPQTLMDWVEYCTLWLLERIQIRVTAWTHQHAKRFRPF